ncbi:hypothetical protein CO115_05245 [Candidatus Falkowbacteria bacterium CG_4_9_14_3_um_filter_36_9]|uniref:Type II secretion system protein GspF domain-containing protein n=1 Tax=Candidatus Falkowbacteria bacterium CG02_land_8_20_14_3_00_36_14 TaxID=1974560 RepID=A0A2M7DKE3_9BACT|nr:MAG: hypothetical protein COS18_05570 [Candidatus Falkowbacteria bacterium CG02_land_8_20_14_3_00_36_14]PIX11812.1 MAG: hypothetical protein COZ73_01815 [Candidatus Falkowbacteria bacterium CG_4_8_14_3_um_filter_36_11]PJA10785.1 MAG: hypothetical protein COX67_03195 [Candidatus Falkowbacteria bacterium CG_4_10_14_0_2_um_filter_36_22]PJB17938.1 MAG: hypothetical protein CO115_05245 [Candidatus Falkowbacteria bacterium CG_4_9_14_3_um_filter_36_9]
MAVNLQYKKDSDKSKSTNKSDLSFDLIIKKINLYLNKFSGVPLREKLFFIQHLGIMLKAGISMSTAINTLSQESENKYFKKILIDIANSVTKGTSLSASLKPYSHIFGELFISMIDAGELSGKLEEVLAQLYIQLKKQHELISKVKGAMTYPAVIIVAMMGIGTFMLVFVVPKITSMFADFNAELPLPTKILISVSNTLVTHGLIVLFILILFIFMIVKILKTYKGKYYMQALLLKTPIFSSIIKKINLAKFARTISSLLKTDIMIIKTFKITGNVMGNLHYRKALMDMAEKIKKGGQINEVIKNYPKLFPPIVVQMVTIGEQTGELDNILLELAEFYENEVDQTMNNLPSIIEPILILFLGCAVGAMAVAIVMPMYSITTAIS